MQYIKTSAIIVIALFIISCGSFPAFAEVGLGFRGGMLIPDEEFDSNFIGGGVLELDSNLGLTLEATVEYFEQDNNSGGEISVVPIVFSAKYNLFPRNRSTPFVGIGAGAFFFDGNYSSDSTKSSKAKSRFGARVSGGFRLFEDRRMNMLIEASRNFTDFDGANASSFQVVFGVIFDLPIAIIGGP